MKRKAETNFRESDSQKRGKLRTVPDSAEDFQSVIRERRLEKTMKARRQRLEDIRRIKEWQSAESVIPFLEIFPKEVWAVVMSQLKDPADVWSMWKVHPMFRNLSEKSRTAEVLFPHIVSFIPAYHINGHRITCTCTYCDDLPNLDYNCRLRCVSKSLRGAVEQCYEDRIMTNLHHDVDAIPFLVIRLPMDRYRLYRFVECFSSGPVEKRAKRCFHRSFELEILQHQVVEMSEEFFYEFAYELILLLQSIGDQLWRFKIKFTNYDWLQECKKFQEGEFWCFLLYDLICQCASHMPNLKWIEFDVYDLHFLRHTIALQSFFKSHPFPYLPLLEKVRFVPCNKDVFLGFELLTSILGSNPCIEILNVKTGHNSEKNVKFFRRLFEYMETIPCQLETLNIDGSLYRNPHTITSLVFLQPLIHLNWPLKEFRISGIDASSKGMLASLFHLLNNFQSLEQLSLSMTASSVGNDLPFLKLPNLTHFHMTIFKDSVDYSRPFNVKFFYSLQFLLYARKLRNLVYINRHRVLQWKFRRFMISHECHEHMLNFRAGRRDLTHSNIWDTFPELAYVRTENHCEEKMITKAVMDLKRIECVKYIREYHNGALASFREKNHDLLYRLNSDGTTWLSFQPDWTMED